MRNRQTLRLARRRLLAGAAASPALAGLGWAQPAWPGGRAVTMVVAFPPGGQADVSARPIAAAMERVLGVPVPVVNRPGAAGALGNAFVARAPGDGHTLLMALSSMLILPEADRIHNRPPQYEVEQLAPIARITNDPTILVVSGDSPWRSLEDFVADARRRPGAISYASSGNFGALHVPMVLFSAAAGIDLLHVPFQGGGPALTALLSGTVQALASGTGPVMQHLQSGRLRALASWAPTRQPHLPDLPTFIELGYRDVQYAIWAGIFAPASTPAPLREQIRAAVARAAQDPDAQRALATAGSPLAYLDGEAFARFVAEDHARLVAVARRIGRVE
ncbi:MAG: tripartite tricarboxylate transporter substrate binding protein [Rhodovarius sp.]|nr:tripartite tricarboxylate transporter substrate binding protein [Rhodovarius sp.]MDW8315512.1 tripartite tricarboxylate transporter substrate binding protein [Rhodovarius sp.]